MKSLNEVQKLILRALTFVESFDTLVEEVPYPEPVIGAELKHLISSRCVQVMRRDGSGAEQRSFYFDGDDLRGFRYIATSRGLEQL